MLPFTSTSFSLGALLPSCTCFAVSSSSFAGGRGEGGRTLVDMQKEDCTVLWQGGNKDKEGGREQKDFFFRFRIHSRRVSLSCDENLLL